MTVAMTEEITITEEKTRKPRKHIKFVENLQLLGLALTIVGQVLVRFDLALVAGTGPKGRITLEDVEAYLTAPLSFMHYQEELTVPQVAEIVGIPEGTVKSRLHKTMNIIRKKLKQYENK